MNILAIETATEYCSVALQTGQTLSGLDYNEGLGLVFEDLGWSP